MGIEFAHQAYNLDLIDFDLTDFVLNKSTNTKKQLLIVQDILLIVYLYFLCYLLTLVVFLGDLMSSYGIILRFLSSSLPVSTLGFFFVITMEFT